MDARRVLDPEAEEDALETTARRLAKTEMAPLILDYLAMETGWRSYLFIQRRQRVCVPLSIDSLDVGSVPWRANLGDGSVTAPPPKTSLA